MEMQTPTAPLDDTLPPPYKRPQNTSIPQTPPPQSARFSIRDPIPLMLFAAHLIALICIAGITLPTLVENLKNTKYGNLVFHNGHIESSRDIYGTPNQRRDSPMFTANRRGYNAANQNRTNQEQKQYFTHIKLMALLVTSALPIALFLAMIWLTTIKRFAGFFIRATLYLTTLAMNAVGIWFCLSYNYFLGVPALITGVFCGWMIYLWKGKLSFSIQLLETVMAITNRYPSTIAFTLLSVLLQLLFLLFWISTTLATAMYWGKNADDNTVRSRKLVLSFLALSLFWTMQVIQNISRVTISGVFATHYFQRAPGMVISNPTWNSCRRAVTTSLGSIALGSLLVASVQVAKLFLKANVYMSKKACPQKPAECVEGILGWILNKIEAILRYCNAYAYTYMAIYGDSFVSSSKKTVDLLRHNGLDAVMNDSIIGYVMTIGSILIGTLLALASFIVTHRHYVYTTISVDVLSAALCFAVGYFVTMTITSVVRSGTTTLFVCYAQAPECMDQNDKTLKLAERIKR